MKYIARLLGVGFFLLAASSYAEVSQGDFAVYQQNIQLETRPDVLEGIVTAVLTGPASYNPPSPPGTKKVYTIFPSGLSPAQSLAILQQVVSAGNLNREQLARLEKTADGSGTTLGKDVEKKQAHDLLHFAQLSYEDQAATCRETRKSVSSTGMLSSWFSDSNKVLDFVTAGAGVNQRLSAYGKDAPVRGSVTTTNDCNGVFSGEPKSLAQSQALEQIHQNTENSADSSDGR